MKTIKKRLIFLAILVSLALGAKAEEPETAGGINPQEQSAYDPAGKRDPFKPFIKLTERENEIKPQVSELIPPIRRYSLNEFKLVGILWMGQQPRAMIVDPEKNTYVLGPGDEIGNREGKIIEIRGSGILVEEKKYLEDIFGQKKIEIDKSVLAFRE